MDRELDTRNYSNTHNTRPRTRNKISDLMNDFDLIDVFRKVYPDKKAYSWRKFNSNKQSRLDYFLISQNLLGEIKRTAISPGYRTDHSLVTIAIRKKEFKRDKTFWKFNNSLLKDKIYVKTVKELIENIKQQYAVMMYLPEMIKDIPPVEINFSISDQLFFETLLMEIRGKTISYASHKKKVETEKEKSLNEKLANMESNNSMSDEDVLELERIRQELEQIRKNRVEGIAVRCRANWINEGEKPTRYFCNLENRNFVNKTVSFLEKTGGVVIEEQSEILKEVEMFYSSLYAAKPINDVEISEVINDGPHLNANDVDYLTNEISYHEIASALKSMNNNKSPGPDGFTVEFFKFFFPDIGIYYKRSICEGLARGELSVTQYQGIITCIPKGEKPKQFIKNWRPISLLNISYKILSTCIANRLQSVLPKIIHNSQKGFMKGRYIGDNIRTLYDIIEYTKVSGIPGLIVAIDFEKAFDSVSWSFIEKSLLFFGFPENIVCWFKSMYRNASSCITFNGQYSNWFKLGRGCRQGDPISPYLYLLCAEIMSLMFRRHNGIKGITIKDKPTLLALFADDTSLFLDGSEASFRHAFEVLDKFSTMSGLKINNEKTQIMWIGSSIGCGVRFMRDRNFIWDPGTFNILGITFSVNVNEIVNLNFKGKINDVKRDIAKWSKRNLTPMGKITLIKTLIMSKLTYLLINLPDPPANFLQEIDNILTRFLWGGKTNKIKKTTTHKPYHEGGIKMYNIYSSLAAFKLSWLKRIENYNNEEFPSLRIHPWLTNLKVYGNAYPEHIRKTIKNPFWLDVLKHLDTLYKIPIEFNQGDSNSILAEPIQFNSNLKIGNRIIVFREWTENNIVTIKDLLDEDGVNFLDYQAFKRKYINTPNTHFLNYIGITQALRQFVTKFRNNFDDSMKCSFWVWEKIKTGNAEVREVIDKDNKPPTATLKWDIFFHGLNWKTIFIKCSKTTIDTQLRWFQTRILHRILPTRKYLYTCKLVTSPLCLQCSENDETLCHLLWECKFAQKFWKDLEQVLKNKCYNCARFRFKLELVLFGTANNFVTDKTIDFIILFAKFYIYRCRFQNTTPNCVSFILCLKQRLDIERMLAIRRNIYNQFQQLWLPYNNIFVSN